MSACVCVSESEPELSLLAKCVHTNKEFHLMDLILVFAIFGTWNINRSQYIFTETYLPSLLYWYVVFKPGSCLHYFPLSQYSLPGWWLCVWRLRSPAAIKRKGWQGRWSLLLAPPSSAGFTCLSLRRRRRWRESQTCEDGLLSLATCFLIVPCIPCGL